MHLWDDEEGYVSKTGVYNYAYLEDPTGEHESITGTRLKMIINPPKNYQEAGILYEDRVPIHTRLLVDLYYDSDEISKNHRIVFFDIEVAKEDGYSDAYDADNTITSITIGNIDDSKYYTIVLDRKRQITKNEYTLKELKSDEEDDINIVVIPCVDEHGLLREFLKIYRKLSPTILSGWNIFKYDLPYLITRLNKILGGVGGAAMLSPIGICRLDEFRGEKRIIIAGVSILDYIDLYKKFTYTEQSSYALNNIAEIELGRTKIEYDGGLDDLLQNDIYKFIAYNVMDVHLPCLFERKFEYIEIARGLCHKGKVPYESIFKTSHYMEGAILSLLKKMGKVSPKRTDYMVSGKAHGAHVKFPMPGVYEWVYDLDLTSLYPSNIMSLNISPETKVAKITNWVIEGFKSSQDFVNNSDAVFNIQFFNNNSPIDVTCQELHHILREYSLTLSANGILYDNTRKGILSTILELWFSERSEFTKLAEDHFKAGDLELHRRYDKKQLIQKILLNSLYGVLLLPSFRFYDRDNGEAVTLTGQQISWFTREVANSYYADIIGEVRDYCIYGDTDSVFYPAIPLINVLYPNSDESDIPELTIKIATDVENYINKMYNEYAQQFHGINEHKWSIKQELVAKSAFWGEVKKRYAMWIVRKKGLVVDKPSITGFDVVKSDFPKAYKLLMTDVLHGILHGKGSVELNRTILDSIAKYSSIDIYTIMRPTGISSVTKWVDVDGKAKSGTPIHVKSAINYNNFLTRENLRDYPRITNGDKIFWCYLKSNPHQYDTIGVPVSQIPEDVYIFVKKYVDIDRMTESTLVTKLQKIWDALGWGRLILKSNLFKYFTYE